MVRVCAEEGTRAPVWPAPGKNEAERVPPFCGYFGSCYPVVRGVGVARLKCLRTPVRRRGGLSDARHSDHRPVRSRTCSVRLSWRRSSEIVSSHFFACVSPSCSMRVRLAEVPVEEIDQPQPHTAAHSTSCSVHDSVDDAGDSPVLMGCLRCRRQPSQLRGLA